MPVSPAGRNDVSLKFTAHFGANLGRARAILVYWLCVRDAVANRLQVVGDLMVAPGNIGPAADHQQDLVLLLGHFYA